MTVGFEHDALMYADLDEFVAATSAFIKAGRDAAEPVMVAVPGEKLAVIRDALNGEGDGVRFVDMHNLGRNPRADHPRSP